MTIRAAGSPGTGATPVSIRATPTPAPVNAPAVPVSAPMMVRTCLSVVGTSVPAEPSQLAQVRARACGTAADAGAAITPSGRTTNAAVTADIIARFLV